MAPGISIDDRNAWDDTSLVDDWNEVVAEYQKYHSIQAQGKRLEDVLSKDELAELRQDYEDLMGEEETRSNNADANTKADHEPAGRPTEDTNDDGCLGQDAIQAEEPKSSGNREESRTAESSAPVHDVATNPAMPQAILGTVQDENLKNLMMSWYYAGYYTGLYVGQQQGTPEAPR
ncbi:uncharacterized protein BDR25DRAFT_342309 [Lindgomyces ingoldianus]|uniref:Uncharacterized protein n=1 Tax=Lindgomyces ingoldianus TaxID=673940 RepID=A0ACB6QX28_9PLEO|nr:uncharacterized protein BDR25DRAFT_342309 [Lindgomyces ingoldianus]KAF2471579.1 hypothetical protein BDR25DRAFT_342309 [Lindgomyces ingoldianus]